MRYLLVSIIVISFLMMCYDFIMNVIKTRSNTTSNINTQQTKNIDLSYSMDLLELINITIDLEICAFFKFDIMAGRQIEYTFFDNAVKKISYNVKDSLIPSLVYNNTIYTDAYIDRFIINQSVLKTDIFMKNHNEPM